MKTSGVIEFPDGRPIPAIDLNFDETELLRRYDTAFRTLVGFQLFPMPTSLPTEKDICRSIQLTLFDFSVSHAFQGAAYVGEIQSVLQYTVLQAALILTINIPMYLNIPDFESSIMEHVFSTLTGFAGLSHLVVIIGSTITAGLLNMPYGEADGLMCRIRLNSYLVMINVQNYVAVVMTVIAVIIAGFNRSAMDGGLILLALVGLGYVLFLLYSVASTGSFLQDSRTVRFVNKYCDSNGMLKEEYLKIVYPN